MYMSTTETKLTPERFEQRREYVLHEVDAEDEYVNEQFLRITESLQDIEAMGFYGDNNIEHALKRKRLSSIDFSNPATAELIRRIPTVEYWLQSVPTAEALKPLYQPAGELVASNHQLSEELRQWVINIADGVGIRNRAKLLSSIMNEVTSGKTDAQITDSKWLSLASGVAQPMLDVAKSIQVEHGSVPKMTLVDLDTKALKGAADYAGALNLNMPIAIERRNVLRLRGLDTPSSFGELAKNALRSKRGDLRFSRNGLEQNGYDFVEAVGILEYLKPEDWQYRYNGVVELKTVQAGAITLLHNAYNLVKPGGDLVVGNMLIDRPQLGFTLNVIQWPHIQPRSIDDMNDIFNKAGLEGERHVYVSSNPDERVYALYKIHKPLVGGSSTDVGTITT